MKQKGEFYKVKKSGFSMLLLLICVSMLSVMPVSAARKKSRYDLQFSDLKVNKKKLKAGEKCEISMKVKNKGTGKIQRLTVTYQGPKRQYYDVLLKYKKKSKRWTGNFTVNKGMEKGIWKIWCVTADKNYDEEYHYSCYNKNLDKLITPGADFSKGNIQISGTKADYKKPKIRWNNLKTWNEQVTAKGGIINCRLKVTDNSGISFVRIIFAKRPEEGKKLIPDISIIMKYNKKTGYYEGSSTQGKGKYLVAGITAADLFGNEIFYYNSQCESYGYYQPENSIRKDLSDLSVSLGISEDDIPQETEKQTESEREPIAKPRKTDVFVNKRSPETSEYDYAVVIDKVVYQYRMETDDYAVVAFDENNGNMEDGRKVKVRAEILGRPVTEVTLHGEFDPPQGRVHLILPESVRKIQIDECTFKAIIFPSTFTKKNSKSIVSECTIGKIYLAGKSVYTGNIYQISGLKTIKLPSKLKYIKAGFLKGSTDLEKISIPNQVRTIGKEAFAGCRNLKIYIPATVKNIGKNAFGKGDGCVKKIYCVKNSAAYKYAKKNNIPYKTVSIKE